MTRLLAIVRGWRARKVYRILLSEMRQQAIVASGFLQCIAMTNSPVQALRTIDEYKNQLDRERAVQKQSMNAVR